MIACPLSVDIFGKSFVKKCMMRVSFWNKFGEKACVFLNIVGHQYTLSADGEVGCFLNKSVAHLMILELCFSRLENLAKWQGLPQH